MSWRGYNSSSTTCSRLSQAAVGRLSMRLEATDAGAVVKRLVETTAPLAWRQRQVQVLAEFEDDTPLARADAQRLEQVVSNLLGNAVRHTPPGGLVAAAVSSEPSLVRVDVRDTARALPRMKCRICLSGSSGPGAERPRWRRPGAGTGERAHRGNGRLGRSQQHPW